MLCAYTTYTMHSKTKSSSGHHQTWWLTKFQTGCIESHTRPTGHLKKMFQWKLEYSLWKTTYLLYSKQTQTSRICVVSLTLARHYQQSTTQITRNFHNIGSALPGLCKSNGGSNSLRWPTDKITTLTFLEQQEKITEENRKLDYQVHIKIRWLKEALQHIEAIEIHGSDLYSDVDGDDDGSTA